MEAKFVSYGSTRKNVMFVALKLHLKLPERWRRFKTADGIAAHSAVIKAITEADSERGKHLHDLRWNKPMTLAFIDDELRLTFLGQDSLSYIQALVNQLHKSPRLQIGRHSIEVSEITTSGAEDVGLFTWAYMCQQSSYRQFSFKFITPTAITRQDEDLKRYTILYPEPCTLFSGLVRRWEDLKGPVLPKSLYQYLTSGGIVIKKYSLSSVKFESEGRTQIGFVGCVTYDCRKQSQDSIAALNWLTRLAPLVGIGYQTARGMGAVSTKFQV